MQKGTNETVANLETCSLLKSGNLVHKSKSRKHLKEVKITCKETDIRSNQKKYAISGNHSSEIPIKEQKSKQRSNKRRMTPVHKSVTLERSMTYMIVIPNCLQQNNLKKIHHHL